eukprot:8741617-Pyramimonas_sp.AAC.1
MGIAPAHLHFGCVRVRRARHGARVGPPPNGKSSCDVSLRVWGRTQNGLSSPCVLAPSSHEL